MVERIAESPKENFERGLLTVDIPDLGSKIQGKVRDIWVTSDKGLRVMVTTDRQSAYDRMICTVPGKGAVLNLMSAWWFGKTKDFAPNHFIAAPHPNVLIARQAEVTIPVEVVWRAYMARSSTSTSVYYNYVNLGRREIYGIKFPEGLRANEEFGNPILTPTTKAETGHDIELTDKEAREIADKASIPGTWWRIKRMSEALFAYGAHIFRQKGLFLVDTKYEIGIDKDGKVMIIDELHTSDSSRIWLKLTYKERFNKGENPDTYDKEILRRWLAENGFRGEGTVPVVPQEVIGQMAGAYRMPYEMVTGNKLSDLKNNPYDIKEVILNYLNK